MAHSNALLSSRSSSGPPSMAEPHAAVASKAMAEDDEVHMNNPELQGTIRFEETLTPLNVPSGIPNSRCSLDIPQWFVEKHGDRLEEFVILRCGTSLQPRLPWVVRLSCVSAASAVPLSVRMSCGWQKFAAFNGLRNGDSVVFHLRALSEFEVFVYPGGSSSSAIRSASSPVITTVEALCEPMQQLLALNDHTGATQASTTTTTTLPPISKLHPHFPMENGRVSSLRTSRSPPINHVKRTVSFSGIDTVYVDTPAVHCNSIRDRPRIPNFLFNC